MQQLAAWDAVGVDQHQLNQTHFGVGGEEVMGFLNIGALHGGYLVICRANGLCRSGLARDGR